MMSQTGGITLAGLLAAALAGFGASRVEAQCSNDYYQPTPVYYSNTPTFCAPSRPVTYYNSPPTYRSYAVNVVIGRHNSAPRYYTDNHRSYRHRDDGHRRLHNRRR